MLPDSAPLQLSAREFHILGVIATHSDETGRSWPSVKTLADKVGVSDRTVQAAIGSLKATSHLKVVEIPGKSCTYVIPWIRAKFETENGALPGDYDAKRWKYLKPPKSGTPEASFTPPPKPASPHPRSQLHPNNNQGTKPREPNPGLTEGPNRRSGTIRLPEDLDTTDEHALNDYAQQFLDTGQDYTHTIRSFLATNAYAGNPRKAFQVFLSTERKKARHLVAV
ncbi:helix-turn-helix domain-containing protein [Rhodococcus erythropolis]